MPPPGMAGAPESFFGLSATIASVVTSRPATELASCKATLTIASLAGASDAIGVRFSMLYARGVDALEETHGPILEFRYASRMRLCSIAKF
jgi:hypothetical protein